MWLTGVPALPISIPATLARRGRPSSARYQVPRWTTSSNGPPVEPLERLQRPVDRVAEREDREADPVGRDGRGSRAPDPGRRRRSGSSRCRGRRPRPASASPPVRGRSRASRAGRSSSSIGPIIAMAAAARAMCAPPRQTSASASSCSRSVTTTKSHGCQLREEGAMRPASRIRSRSSAGIVALVELPHVPARADRVPGVHQGRYRLRIRS